MLIIRFKHILDILYIMNKNHFFIPYFGNKRQEVEKIYEFVKDKLPNIEYIVEPFAGTSAFSYYLSTKHKGRYKYILNDNNKFIYKLYSMTTKEKEILKEELIALHRKIKSKEDYCREIKGWETDFIKYIFANKIYNIRPGLYPQGKNISEKSFDSIIDAPINDFLKSESIRIFNKDALDIYNEYKNNDKALIFLDPPYLIANNDFYKNPNVNIYEYLFENDIIKEKGYIILCLSNNWIIKLLFNKKKSYIYDKRYETTKKDIKHIIISNEKILNNTT